MKKLTLLLLVALSFTFTTNSFAQKNYQQADSLRRVYQNKQSLDTAYIYANKALKFAEEKYGKNDTVYANMLIGIFEVCYYLGKDKEAINYLLQEKQIREAKQGEYTMAYATNLSNLAVMNEVIGKYDDALSLYKKSLEITEKLVGKNHPEYGVSLNNLAVLYTNMGRYNKALPLFKEALKNAEKTQGKDNYEYALSLNNIAMIYELMADYDKALKLYKQTLKIIASVKGEKHPDYIISLGNVGTVYEEMGRFDKALPIYLEVLDVVKKNYGINHKKYGQGLNNLAMLYEKMGQYQKALSLYLQAIENTKKNYGKNHPIYGGRLNNIAYLYERMGMYDKALPLYIEAVENCKATLGEKHPTYAVRLSNLSKIYRELGQLDKAKEMALEVLDNTEKYLGKDHPSYGMYLNNLAMIYKKMGQFDKALPICKESIRIELKTFGKEHSDYAISIINLAEIYKGKKEYDKALPLFKEGIQNLNYSLERNFAFLSEKEKENFFNMVNKYFDIFNSFALQLTKENKSIATTVFDNTVRNKGILLKSSTSMRLAILNSKDTTLINKYNKWISLKKKIAKLYSLPISNRDTNIDNLIEQATVIERYLVRNSNEFSTFNQTLKIDWKKVQNSLKENEAAIEFTHFTIFDNKGKTDSIQYCALIVTPKSKYPKMIPIFEEKQLENIIGKFGGNNYSYINSIYGKNTEVNKELYNLIWKPMEGNLKGVKKVYISPDGLLHKISFSAIAKDQNVYLCDVYDIEVKSSTGKITEDSHTMTSSHRMTTATLFGGITYDTDSTKQKVWNYLEGTKTETQKIDKILKKGKVKVNYYTNTSATEGEFKLMASNSDILHIATHGFFYPDPKEVEKEENKKEVEYSEVAFRGGSRGFGVNSFVENTNPLMRSGLVFAGANDVWSKQIDNDTIDDGILTAQEVSNIDMRKTDLVVMSACETGLGDIKGSEGVYGLQRAFKMAGVKYEIMSLWQVPDKETEEFMTSFYKKLIKQKDIKQAFAETQKEMRKKYDPYFWAAFVLIE